MRGASHRFRNLALAALLALPALAPSSAPHAAPVSSRAVAGVTAVPLTVAPAVFTLTSTSSVDDHILVAMKPGHAASSLAGKYGVSAAGVKSTGHVVMVTVPKGKTPAQLAAELAADPNVAGASPDYVRHVTGTYTSAPNDTAYTDGTAYSLNGFACPYGKSWWERTYGQPMATVWGALGATTYGPRATGAAITVAVIDTGFYVNHPDAGSNIVAGKDEFQTYTFATNHYTTDNDVTPASPQASGNNTETASHGTCVAGQIAAATNNGIGVAGVSYDTTVRMYKVMGTVTDTGTVSGTIYTPGSVLMLDSALINAINDATADGVKVISMSLGGPDDDYLLQSAITNAYNHGVLVVAATGNEGGAVSYPGADNHVIGVGSYELDSSDARECGARSRTTGPASTCWHPATRSGA
jgi:hypothetical protein